METLYVLLLTKYKEKISAFPLFLNDMFEIEYA
jgi:hypothetical protein